MEKGNIYSFIINKKVTEKVETVKKNKDGEEETVIKNKTVEKPVQFIVKKPSRRLAEEAEIHYSVELSKAIKMGILTKAMLVKKYSDSGGALTEEENKNLLRQLKEVHDLENELMLKTSEGAKEEDIKELKEEIMKHKKELIELESSLQGVYQHTADSRAERQTLLWYAVNLAKMKNDDGEFVSFFEGVDYEQQLEDLYTKDEEGSESDKKAVSTILKVIGYWFYAQNATQEDLDKFIKTQEEKEKKSEG